MSREELELKIGRPGVVLVEALPANYFQRGHLPGAINIPLDGYGPAATAQALPDKAAEIVVYCSGPSCSNSHAASARLESLGYSNVRVFAGGKLEWTDAGNDLEVTS
jgi:rhodanese-related sulfurtransferase